MKHSICILLLIFFPIIFYAQNDFDSQLDSLAKEIAAKISHKGKKQIAISDITDLDTTVTELGKYISNNFSVNLTNSSDSIVVVDRNHLNNILREHRLRADGYIDPLTAKQLGKFIQVDAIITGNIVEFKSSDKIKLTVYVIDAKTSAIIAATKGTLTLSSEIKELMKPKEISSQKTYPVKNSNTPTITIEQVDPVKPKKSTCEEKNLGDYCFNNQTSQTVYVSIYDMDDEYNKSANPYVQLNAKTSLTIQPNTQECLYQYPARSWRYTVGGVRQGTYGLVTIKSGDILIQPCKSQTVVIK